MLQSLLQYVCPRQFRLHLAREHCLQAVLHIQWIDITSVRGVASISSLPATSDVYTAVYIYCNGNDGVTYNANDNGYGGYNAASVTASGCTFVSASAHYWLYTSTHPLSEIYQTGTISV